MLYTYIDARHDYTGVTEDMDLYWDKLKCGGIFAGHDWSVDHKGVRRTDGKAVKSAVIEFASKKKRSLFITTSVFSASWYFRK